MLALDFMRQALVAAVLVGIAAPMIGVFLVQRQMSLIGDGIGHVALAGVAAGFLTGTMPLVTALIAAVAAGAAVEFIRLRGRTGGDLALAVMFYGGIALGVVLMALSPTGTPANLTAYLFGSLLTTSSGDLVLFAVLAALVMGVTWVLRPRFFAVAQDEEYSRASGLHVTALNVTLAVLTAVTVVVSMRIIGLLLISALMILPNATGQLLGRSFAATIRWAVAIGVACAVVGVTASFYAGTPSGATIVLVAITCFLLAAGVQGLRGRAARARHERAERHLHEHGPACGHESVTHGDHVDYLHDGHRHAAHGDHWDEHADHADHADHTHVDVEEGVHR
jgi:zinc transport system permease protein